MKFPFREFWGRLIVKFGEYTYKSISGAISNNRELRIESEDNDKAHWKPGLSAIQWSDLLGVSLGAFFSQNVFKKVSTLYGKVS